MEECKQVIDDRGTCEETLRVEIRELMEENKHLRRKIDRMEGTISALAFAVRCNGVSGSDVRFDG